MADVRRHDSAMAGDPIALIGVSHPRVRTLRLRLGFARTNTTTRPGWQYGLLRRTLLLPVVANKALYYLPPLVPTLVESR